MRNISVTHVPTNVDWASESNTDGIYRIPGLPDGPYKLTVTSTGFTRFVREGFSLRIGENLNMDIKLEVGAITESINVTNSVPLIETQTSSTGQVMEGDYFYDSTELPALGKGVALYYTPPGGDDQRPLARRAGKLEFQRLSTATRRV